MTGEKVIKEFKDKIQLFKNNWKSIDIRIICFFSEQQRKSLWRNITTKVILRSESVNDINIQPGLPDLPNFKAIHKIWAINQLDNLLNQLLTGKLCLDEIEVRYKKRDGSPEFSPSFFKWQRGEKRSSSNDWTYYCLSCRGEYIGSLLSKELDEQLKSLDVPYTDCYDLFKNFLGIDRYYSDQSLIEIIAPLGIRITNFEWVENALKINFEFLPSWIPYDISLGLIYYFRDKEPKRLSKSISLEEQKFVVISDVPKDFQTAKVILRMKGIPVDEISVVNPACNPIFTIYEEYFDKNLELLSNDLSHKGEQSKKFEEAVEMLLYLCGFCPAPFIKYRGNPGRVDIRGADILCISATDENFLVVECTTAMPNRDKLHRLRGRADSLKNKGYYILPVLFTSYSKSELDIDVLKKAGQDGISIIGKEEIITLIEMAKKNLYHGEIYSFLVENVPDSLVKF